MIEESSAILRPSSSLPQWRRWWGNRERLARQLVSINFGNSPRRRRVKCPCVGGCAMDPFRAKHPYHGTPLRVDYTTLHKILNIQRVLYHTKMLPQSRISKHHINPEYPFTEGFTSKFTVNIFTVVVLSTGGEGSG